MNLIKNICTLESFGEFLLIVYWLLCQIDSGLRIWVHQSCKGRKSHPKLCQAWISLKTNVEILWMLWKEVNPLKYQTDPNESNISTGSFLRIWLHLVYLEIEWLLNYRTRSIIIHGLYIFYPIFEDHFFVFKEVFFGKFCHYVWLVFKSSL